MNNSLFCIFVERVPSSPLLVRGEVGAIPIATGEVQRQHTHDAYSCTQAIVLAMYEPADNGGRSEPLGQGVSPLWVKGSPLVPQKFRGELFSLNTTQIP